MLCKKPFVRQLGLSKAVLETNEEARLAATPFGCGQCLPCRINRSRVWRTRILLESHLHPSNSFATLTYDDDNIPPGGSVEKEEMQNFIKRLRKNSGVRLRYFGVGEYGGITRRPHYHLALFGLGLEGQSALEASWKKGFSQLGELNKHSASYITGYINKGMTKDEDPRLLGLKPEFMLCSKFPGLGGDAADILAQKCLEHGEKNGVIRDVQLGKKKLPLGRYLTKRLNHKAEVPECQFEAEFEAYQLRLFDEHLKPGREIFMLEDLKEKNSGKIATMEHKMKFHSQRRSL